MAGFPNRITRAALGPTPANRKPVRSAVHNLDAAVQDLALWQLSGCGIMVARVWGVAHWSGSAMVLDASGEAWDPNGLWTPLPQRAGVGDYTIEYPATVADKDGNAITTLLVATNAQPQSTTWHRCAHRIIGSRTVAVKTWDATGATPTDVAFWWAAW